MDKGTIVCKFSNDAMHKNLKKGARKKKLANLQNYDIIGGLKNSPRGVFSA